MKPTKHSCLVARCSPPSQVSEFTDQPAQAGRLFRIAHSQLCDSLQPSTALPKGSKAPGMLQDSMASGCSVESSSSISRFVRGDFSGHSEVEPFLRRSSISITILGISYSHSFEEVMVFGRLFIMMPGHQFASRKTTAMQAHRCGSSCQPTTAGPYASPQLTTQAS